MHSLKKSLFISVLLLLVLVLGYSLDASATGPRIKQDLFAPSENPIYAQDFPPFITTERADGGVAIALAKAVLQTAQIDAPISTLPLARMLKYYLTQENALAVIAKNISLSKEQQQNLVAVPLLRMKKIVYFHKAINPKGLPWNGELKSLAGLTYGAEPEEDQTVYQQLNIVIKTGSLLTLLEKLKDGSIDFIMAVEPAVDWLVQRALPTEKNQFARLEPAAGEETIFVLFNKKHSQGEKLAKQFQTGLSTLVANGRYQAILQEQLTDSQALSQTLIPLP